MTADLHSCTTHSWPSSTTILNLLVLASSKEWQLIHQLCQYGQLVMAEQSAGMLHDLSGPLSIARLPVMQVNSAQASPDRSHS